MNKILKSIIGIVSAVVVLVGISPIGVKAEDSNNGRAWTTYSYAPGAEKMYDTVKLYSTDEEYKWSVTSIKLNGCSYSYVELGCNNGTVTMKNNVSKRMSTGGSKNFTINKTDTDMFMYFVVSMVRDTYGPSYGGRIDILVNT